MTRLMIVLTALLALTTAASAQQNCGPRAVVVEHLTENFGESRQTIGMGQDGQVVEVYASTETGSWTIIVTLPNGSSCLVAAGDAFEVLAEAPAPTGTAS